MSRRQRIDSATGAVAVMLKAAKRINPPAHAPLDDDALPFWNEIVAARAQSEWNDHDLTCASDLANTMAQLVENRRMLRAEGEVLRPEGGKEFANPRVAVVHGLHAQIKSARQSLYIHGRTAGKVEDVAKRRAQAREIEAGSPLAGDDEELLARPTVQ
ncbi:MAG: terminase small subunit [Brevundimonas sp.]|nr:MAG: terminase small subunit [Brevundimonas sp.]